MQNRLGILFLLLSLFVALSANRAWACKSNDAEHSARFHEKPDPKPCCIDDSTQVSAHCNERSDFCKESHPGESCPDEDGCGGCHCPGCGVVSGGHGGSLLIEFLSILPSFCDSEDANRQAFYFAEHVPEAVFLPIWQPPKLDA